MASKLITFLTMEEVKKLLKAEKRRDYKLAIALGFGSGLRISEIVGAMRGDGQHIPPLMPENVNLKSHQIKVVQGKGKKDRITVTSPWLTSDNLNLLPISIKTRTLQHNFGALCKKVLGRHCNFHMLRHGFGNYMHVEKRVPLTVLQQLMGHTRSDVTAQYARANPEEAVKQAWEAF